MLNKKRLLAMGMTSAMIMASLAGCSNDSSSSSADTSSSAETEASSAEADATDSGAEESSEDAGDDTSSDSVAPTYSVEEGKVVDFEDGNMAFVVQNEANLAADAATLEVADFNGSKALKVSPNSTSTGKTFELGIDVLALLGDAAADAASVSMQIGVEATDGKFYAVTGTIKQNSTDSGSTTWATYVETKNPNSVTVTFDYSYDTTGDCVLVISKDADSGNNADTAYAATGEYSSLYVDNIVFYDADGNALDVDTTAEFAAESYGTLDWSNLIEVTDQVVIDGFSEGETSGWVQGSWHQNIVETPVQATDEDGNLLEDEDGNPVYEQEVDENGDPVYDENGDPVYVTETSGDFDWTSVMKPGTVFTLYYNSEMTEDLNHYIWFVMTFSEEETAKNSSLGWARIKDAPHAATEGLEATDVNGCFATNDSNTMAQITFEEIEQFIADVYGVDDIDWSGNYSIQAEAGMTWSLSAVTYALDQEY